MSAAHSAFIALAPMLALAAAPAPASAEVKSVIELFTSQGCSSCPSADRLLGEYAARPDVLTLSYNVDYWDYLGWKDTLASPDNTRRQRDYAVSRGGDGEVYTPQVIVNGRTVVIGNHRNEIDAALLPGGLTVPISLVPGSDMVTVNIGAAPTSTPHATLWLVVYTRTITVSVGRGENSGKALTYTDVVRKLVPVGMWTGAPMSVNLPRSQLDHVAGDGSAVLLQTEVDGGRPGAIIGAAAIDPSI